MGRGDKSSEGKRMNSITLDQPLNLKSTRKDLPAETLLKVHGVSEHGHRITLLSGTEEVATVSNHNHLHFAVLNTYSSQIATYVRGSDYVAHWGFVPSEGKDPIHDFTDPTQNILTAVKQDGVTKSIEIGNNGLGFASAVTIGYNGNAIVFHENGLFLFRNGQFYDLGALFDALFDTGKSADTKEIKPVGRQSFVAKE